MRTSGPTTYDRDIADRIIEVSDADSFAMTRRLAREEALLVGGSSGMAAYAAVQLAHELDGTPEGEDAVIVVLLPDSGRGYLTKVFNDEWLGQYGFLPPTGEQTVGEVLRSKKGEIPALVHTHPTETIAEAIHILQEYGVSQMPVVRAEPPIVAAEVAGSVSERALLDALFSGHAKLVDQVEDHMDAALPTIGSNEPVSDAVNQLEGADALLVQEDGKPIGVVTRQDLLAYLATSGFLRVAGTRLPRSRGNPPLPHVNSPRERGDCHGECRRHVRVLTCPGRSALPKSPRTEQSGGGRPVGPGAREVHGDVNHHPVRGDVRALRPLPDGGTLGVRGRAGTDHRGGDLRLRLPQLQGGVPRRQRAPHGGQPSRQGDPRGGAAW